jgi:hypothetical protein
MRVQALLIIALATIAMQGLTTCTVAPENKILQFNSRLALGIEGQAALSSTPEMISELVSTSQEGPLADGISLKHQVNRDLESIIRGPVDAADNLFQVEDLGRDNWEKQIEDGFSQITDIDIDVSKAFSEPQFEEPYFEYSVIAGVNTNIFSLIDSGAGAKDLKGSNFSWWI